MASHHGVPIHDHDSTTADSLASTPRSDLPDDSSSTSTFAPRIRFMCSFGGKILPRPHDNQLRYVGGDTRIVSVHRHGLSFLSLLAKLSKLSGTTNISIKYQLPNEDLDALITVTGDDDIENMIEEYDRLTQPSQKSARLRVFLFPNDFSIGSLLDGSAKRENWFFDALNGGPRSDRTLDRVRSEVSSIVSEVPDYLFGLDNSEDGLSAKVKDKIILNESDRGSPAPAASSPFDSTSSAIPIPNLPPVKTKLEEKVQKEVVNDRNIPSAGYSGSPMWQYPNPNPNPNPPTVYYVPGSGNGLVQPYPVRAQFVQQYGIVNPGQVPVGFTNQVYGAGRIVSDNPNQAVYYGVRNMGVVPGSYYPGMVVSGGEEMQMYGQDGGTGRVSQGL